MAEPNAAVETFLREYIEAFLARDGARIAAMYNTPFATVRADGSIHAFNSQEETRSFFQRVADSYYQEGSRGWKYENLTVVPLGGRSVLATLDWEMRRADGGAIRRWRQSYAFVTAGAGLRVLASIFHQA